MRLARGATLVALVALAAAPLALGETTNRYRPSTHPEGKAYSPQLAVVLTSPPLYVLDAVGRLGNDAEWKGPRYQATGRASLGGLASLGWSAGLYRTPAMRGTIAANLVHDWQVVAQGREPVERTVGGRTVGTLPGTWLLTQGDQMAGEARYEAGLAFPLCGRTALVQISALLPSGDSAGGAMGFGEYVIEGVAPTVWNRTQVLATIEKVAVDGSLPAARVTGARRGQAVAGRVTDCNGHPVAGQAVQLERRAGAGWQVVSRGRTTPDGTYRLAARGTGPFRAAADGRRSAALR